MWQQHAWNSANTAKMSSLFDYPKNEDFDPPGPPKAVTDRWGYESGEAERYVETNRARE